MENKTYYGEYTLSHWIELILKKNIILPPYQRKFVWKENKVLELIDTLNRKEFVPPVTIGLFKTDAGVQNLILDGQQRLTSILLAYLDIMPDPETYKASREETTTMGDVTEGEDEQEEYGTPTDDILNWTFGTLTEKGSTKEKILSRITLPGDYKRLGRSLPDAFFEERYLGFSFIVPQDDDPKNQQKFYSSVFRNINIQGQPLLAQESREALYYFNSEMPDFFNPEFCKQIRLRVLSAVSAPLDFVRYMSLLSQYHADKESTRRLARGFRGNMERYYENYIYAVLKERADATYGDFDAVFPQGDYKPRLQNLASAIQELRLPGESPFSSIIDMDTWLFGLIYQVMFLAKRPDPERIEEQKQEIESQIGRYKGDEAHRRSPNAFKYMRPRVSESIQIYSRYVIAE